MTRSPRSSRSCRARAPTAGARRSGSHPRRPRPRSPGSPRCCPIARDPDGIRPFLHIETHLWVRPLSRIVRLVSPRPAFGWYGEPLPEAESTLGGTPREALPAVYCRHCGRSGWAAISPERDPAELTADPHKIYRAAVSDKRLVRAVHRRHRAGGRGARGRPAGRGRRSSCSNPTAAASARSTRTGTPAPSGNGAAARRRLRPRRPAARHARANRPPSGTAARPARWTRAPGSSAPAWPASPRSPSPSCSPAVSSTTRSKTLLFNDSVQDAAHRAGFVASRSYSFSLRTLLAAVLDNHPGRRGAAQRPHRRRDHQRVRPAAGCPPSSRPTCRAAPTWTRCSPARHRATRTPGG